MIRVAVSLGSNLGDREAALRHGVAALAEHPGVTGVRVSSVYETDPVGGPDQPDFLNIVAVADVSSHDPAAVARSLLHLARRVEADLHRVRDVRWGPRTLDMDVLAVGGWTSSDPELTVPHPRAAQRAFVLVPWAEVDPEFEVPGHGPVSALAGALPDRSRNEVRRTRPWVG